VPELIFGLRHIAPQPAGELAFGGRDLLMQHLLLLAQMLGRNIPHRSRPFTPHQVRPATRLRLAGAPAYAYSEPL